MWRSGHRQGVELIWARLDFPAGLHRGMQVWLRRIASRATASGPGLGGAGASQRVVLTSPCVDALLGERKLAAGMVNDNQFTGDEPEQLLGAWFRGASGNVVVFDRRLAL